MHLTKYFISFYGDSIVCRTLNFSFLSQAEQNRNCIPTPEWKLFDRVTVSFYHLLGNGLRLGPVTKQIKKFQHRQFHFHHSSIYNSSGDQFLPNWCGSCGPRRESEVPLKNIEDWNLTHYMGFDACLKYFLRLVCWRFWPLWRTFPYVHLSAVMS